MKTKLNLIIFLLFLLASVLVSVGSRSMQYVNHWQAASEQFYTGDIPAVSTLDAYKWVRIADEYRNNTYNSKGTDDLMYYPDGHPAESPVPLLSVLLAGFAGLFDGNLYEAGLWLIPWLASLFMIPFAIYFYRMGYPVAGILGAVLGSFAIFYYMRTGPGRIDTDALNLFFPFLTALMIMLATHKGITRRSYVFAALAGLSQLLFYWWYQHAAFILIFFIAFAATLALTKFKAKDGELPFGIKEILIMLGLYVLFANPYWFALSIGNSAELLKAYFFETKTFSNGFPNIYHTVSEAKGVPLRELVPGLFINPVIIMFALLGLGNLCIRHLRQMLPILPVFAIGLLVFVGSIRFVMFLIPFLGLGIGYLINFAMLKLPMKKDLYKELLAYGMAMLLVLAIWKVPFPGFAFYAAPDISIEPVVYDSFNTMKRELPEDSVIYTWWDYGLAIEAQTGFATFHDGMTQNTLKTWLIARSFTKDEATFAKYARYIANEGMAQINEMLAADIKATEIIAMIESYDKPLLKDNIYIAFTPDMIYKFGAINYIGSWNVIDGMPARDSAGVDAFSCTPSRDRILNCSGVIIDLDKKLINDRIPVKRIEYLDVSTSTLTGSKQQMGADELGAVVVQEAGASLMLVLGRTEVYNSAFFRMFVAGEYESENFEKIIDNFPLSRVYKLK